MGVAKAAPPRRPNRGVSTDGGKMIRNTEIELPKKLRRENGIGLVELLVVVAVVGIVSVIAVANFRSSRATLRLQNSVRQLASYMEKARIDAVRRHTINEVKFTSPTSYTVNMDFSNTGVPTTRSFDLESGAQVANNSGLPTVRFNWRGRTVTPGASCVTTFAVINTNDPDKGLNVDVSGSGDVTVENQQPNLPNVSYNDTITSTSSVKANTVVKGTETVDSTPCLDVSGEGVGGESGPPLCTIHLSTTSVSVKKNGGATASVVASMSVSSPVVVAYPTNLTVTPASQTVSTGSNFVVKSNNTLRGPFNVTFSSQCGSAITLKVNVTN
jgi:type II secretory pathway pseudopilin PulG